MHKNSKPDIGKQMQSCVRVDELKLELIRFIDEYSKDEPSLTMEEVEQAMLDFLSECNQKKIKER